MLAVSHHTRIHTHIKISENSSGCFRGIKGGGLMGEVAAGASSNKKPGGNKHTHPNINEQFPHPLSFWFADPESNLSYDHREG